MNNNYKNPDKLRFYRKSQLNKKTDNRHKIQEKDKKNI